MNSALNAVLGNWEIGGIVTLHSGNALTLNNFGGWGVGRELGQHKRYRSVNFGRSARLQRAG